MVHIYFDHFCINTVATGALLAILGPLKENHFGPHAPPKGYGFHSIWLLNCEYFTLTWMVKY